MSSDRVSTEKEPKGEESNRAGGDLFIRNAHVLTMVPEAPPVEAVLVRSGRVTAVGTSAELRPLAADAVTIDAGGGTVVPGFVDAHSHFELTCLTLERFINAHAPPCRSLDEIVSVIRADAGRCDGYDWLVCRSSFGLQDKVTEARLFTRADLDVVSPDRPLVVFAGLHVAMLNSVGLARLGLLDGRVPRGSTLQRDGSGEPTGVVTEVFHELPPWPAEEIARAVSRHSREVALQNGITSVASIAVWQSEIDGLKVAERAGHIPLRVVHYPVSPWLVPVDEIETLASKANSDNRVGVGGVKLFVDGQGGDGVSALFDDLKYSQEELDAVVGRASRAGLQTIMHAVTRTGIKMAARAIFRSDPSGDNPLRHRIEHGADYIGSENVCEVRSSGAVLVTTPHFILSDAEDFAPSSPLRTLLDTGIPVAGGTDSTGTVPEGNSPLFNVSCAVSRRRADGASLGQAEAISALEALRLFTSSAAWACRSEHEKGLIAPGLLGDLVLLSADPLSCNPDAIGEIGVDATIIGGEVVFSR